MMKSVLIVTNFNAGRRKAIKYKKAVIDFVLKYTKSFKSVGIEELETLDVSEFDTILTMGGDGTVNKVLPYLINTDRVLGIIPTGTANLLAAKLGLSYKLKKTLQIIEKNNVKSIDVLNINGSNCVLRCGFGYDSDIICRTPQSLKNRFGYFAYFIAGILFALRLKKKHYDMVIDGKSYLAEASSLVIANAPNMYRNFVSLAGGSKPDDGVMEIFLLKTTNPIIFFIEFLMIIMNIRKNSFRAEYIRAKEIDIKNDWLVSHIDGEKKNLKNNISIKINQKSVKVFSTF